jgi:murein DD-endopeptidase MepM/ murein hydrolase activator NlpD
MARVRYRYNPDTCAYEPVFATRRQLAKRTAWFLAVSLLVAIAALIWYTLHFQSWDERELQKQNALLKSDWEILQDRLRITSASLARIESNDDDSYRILLDMPKLDNSIRNGGTGGHETYVLSPAERKFGVIDDAYKQFTKINNRLAVEQQSLQAIGKEIQVQEEMEMTRPAMQPINNRQLTRLNYIFGLRMHPILNYVRPHNGLDLTAPYGTPIYAPGNGYVTRAELSGGLGNAICINHGFGFETRYGHLSRYNVVEGQHVKRGDLIGFVGSTGLSTNSHLHYEVVYKGKYINPLNFLYTDTKQEEYNKLLH